MIQVDTNTSEILCENKLSSKVMLNALCVWKKTILNPTFTTMITFGINHTKFNRAMRAFTRSITPPDTGGGLSV